MAELVRYLFGYLWVSPHAFLLVEYFLLLPAEKSSITVCSNLISLLCFYNLHASQDVIQGGGCIRLE